MPTGESMPGAEAPAADATAPAEEPAVMTGPPVGFEGRPATGLTDVFEAEMASVDSPMPSGADGGGEAPTNTGIVPPHLQTEGQPVGTGLDEGGRGEPTNTGVVPPHLDADVLGGDLVKPMEQPYVVDDGAAVGAGVDEPLDPRLTTTPEDLFGDDAPLDGSLDADPLGVGAPVLTPDPLGDAHLAADGVDEAAPPEPMPEPEPVPDPADDQPDDPTIL
jgi:hypothetical protein